MEQLNERISQYSDMLLRVGFIHEGQDNTIQLLDEPLFFFAIMVRIPIKDVQPSNPETPRCRLGGRADHDAILHHRLRNNLRAVTVKRRPVLLLGWLDSNRITVRFLLRGHDCDDDLGKVSMRWKRLGDKTILLLGLGETGHQLVCCFNSSPHFLTHKPAGIGLLHPASRIRLCSSDHGPLLGLGLN